MILIHSHVYSWHFLHMCDTYHNFPTLPCIPSFWTVLPSTFTPFLLLLWQFNACYDAFSTFWSYIFRMLAISLKYNHFPFNTALMPVLSLLSLAHYMPCHDKKVFTAGICFTSLIIYTCVIPLTDTTGVNE